MFINFDVHAGGEEQARRSGLSCCTLCIGPKVRRPWTACIRHYAKYYLLFSNLIYNNLRCSAINKWIWSIKFCLARFHKYGRQDLPHWSPRSSLQSPKSSLRSPRSSLRSPRSKGRPRCNIFVLLFCKFTAKFFLQYSVNLPLEKFLALWASELPRNPSRRFTLKKFFCPTGHKIY